MIQHAHICPLNYPCMHFILSLFPLSPFFYQIYRLLYAFGMLLISLSLSVFVFSYQFPSFQLNCFLLFLVIYSYSGQQEQKERWVALIVGHVDAWSIFGKGPV